VRPHGVIDLDVTHHHIMGSEAVLKKAATAAAVGQGAKIHVIQNG
jgi:hypothetical protein